MQTASRGIPNALRLAVDEIYDFKLDPQVGREARPVLPPVGREPPVERRVLRPDAGRDPVEYRLELLGEHPRHSAVLQLAADRAGWGKPLAEGKARGVALHESFNTRVAQVAELSRMPNGGFQIDRVVIAVDCGIAINPDVIRAQMEGGMGYGLSATLESEITIENGAVVEGNFDGYRVLRIGQMPKVEVHIVKSAEPPTGVGEPATPVIAPAVANALFALDGKRARRLPLGVNS